MRGRQREPHEEVFCQLACDRFDVATDQTVIPIRQSRLQEFLHRERSRLGFLQRPIRSQAKCFPSACPLETIGILGIHAE
jgi:hypothetical protein